VQAQVTTKFRHLTSGVKGKPELILDVALIPRGSGNRAAARRLAKQFREEGRLKSHLKRVVAGSSRVTVHLRLSVDLLEALDEMKREHRERVTQDVPGQLSLFGVLA
jgi:hypothetical protein